MPKEILVYGFSLSYGKADHRVACLLMSWGMTKENIENFRWADISY